MQFHHTFKNHALLALASLLAALAISAAIERRWDDNRARAAAACVSTDLDASANFWTGDTNANDTVLTAHASSTGTVTFEAGKVSNAFYFDDATDYSSTGTTNRFQSNGFTMSAWVYASGTPSASAGIMGAATSNGSSGYHLEVDATGTKYQCRAKLEGVTSASVQSTTSISPGSFQFVACAFDGAVVNTTNDLKIYVNGVLEGSVGIDTPVPATTHFRPQVFAIGAADGRSSSVTNGFYGLIDEVEVLNQARPAIDIEAIHSVGSGGKCKTFSTLISNELDISIRNGAGVSHQYGVTATGGTPPRTFSVPQGVLPAGLSLSSGGLLTGTTTTATSSSTFTLRVTDAEGNIGQAQSGLTVLPACTTTPSGLVSWWRAYNSANDSTGTNHGTISGSVTFATTTEAAFDAPVGYFAFNMGGSSGDHITVPVGESSTLQLTSEMSISVWVSPDVLTQFTEAGIISTGAGGYKLAIYSEDYDTNTGNEGDLKAQRITWGKSGIDELVSDGAIVQAGTRVHIVVTHSAGTRSIYVDGALTDTNTGYANFGAISSLTIGDTITGSADGNFNGLIEDLQIYNVALTAAQVTNLYNENNTNGYCADAGVDDGDEDEEEVVARGSSAFYVPEILPVESCVAGVEGLVGRLSGDGARADLVYRDGILPTPPDVVEVLGSTVDAIIAFLFDIGKIFGIQVPPKETVTLSAGASTGPGKVGDAYIFGGTAFARVASNAKWNLSDKDFTFQAWVSADRLGADGLGSVIAGSGGPDGGWAVHVAHGALVFSHMHADGTTKTVGSAAFSPKPGAWHHVAVVRAAGTVRLYIDGAQKGIAASAEATPMTRYPLVVGAYRNAGYFSGKIDEVEMYDRALDESAITNAYAGAGLAGCREAILVKPELDAAETGAVFSHSLQAYGGRQPYTGFTASSIPIGLSLAYDGTLSGSVSSPGDYAIEVSVIDAAGVKSPAVPIKKKVVAAPSCVLPPAGILALWKGDASGADLLGKSEMKLSGGAAYAPARVRHGFSFDGINDYATAAMPTAPGSFTFSAWVKPLAYDAGIIAERKGLFTILSDGTGAVAFGALRVPALTLFDGAFHHLAATYDAGARTQALYIDGALVASARNVPAPTSTASGTLSLGAASSGALPWHGVVDEAAMFGRVLAVADLAKIIGARSAGMCADFAIITESLPTLTAGTDASHKIEYIGAPSATFRVVSGDIPPGMKLEADGTLSGTPTVPGEYTIIIEAVSGPGASAPSGRFFAAIKRVFGARHAAAAGSATKEITIVVEASGAMRCAIPPYDMVAWWSGDKDNRDYFGRHLRLEGKITPEGKVGAAFDLSRPEDFIEFPAVEKWGRFRAYTLDMWAKPLSAENVPELFRRLPVGEWSHFTLVWDGETYTHYVNGADPVSTTEELLPPHEISAFQNGVETSLELGKGWSVILDEIEFFSRPLLGAEVASIAAAGSAGTCKPIAFRPPMIPETAPGVHFSHKIELYNAPNAYYQVVSSGMPSWMRLSSSGELSGIPPESDAGKAFSFEVEGVSIDESVLLSRADRVLRFFGIKKLFAQQVSGKARITIEKIITNPAEIPQDAIEPPDGLVAWFPAKGSGNDIPAFDYVPGDGFTKEPGILKGDARMRPRGKVGSAFEFSGAGSVEIPKQKYLDVSADDFGIAFWVNFSNIDGEQTIATKRDPKDGIGWRIYKNSQNQIVFAVVGDNASYAVATSPEPDAKLKKDVPYFLAFIKKNLPDGTARLSILLDGRTLVSGKIPARLPDAGKPLVLGSYFGGLKGYIDEFELFGTGGISRKRDSRLGPYDRVNDYFTGPKALLERVWKSEIGPGKLDNLRQKRSALPVTQQYVYAADTPFELEGGTAPFYCELASGTLPPGMLLGAQTCVLSGVPMHAGNFEFAVTVSEGEYVGGPVATRPTLVASFLHFLGLDQATAQSGEQIARTVRKKQGGRSGKIERTRKVVKERKDTKPAPVASPSPSEPAVISKAPYPRNLVAWLAGDTPDKTPAEGVEGELRVASIDPRAWHASGVVGYTPNDPTVLNAAKVGRAFDFTKPGAFIRYPKKKSAPDFNSEASSFGFDAWVRFADLSCDGKPCEMAILSHGDPRTTNTGFLLYKTKTNDLELCFGDETVSKCFGAASDPAFSKWKLEPGKWHFVAMSLWEEEGEARAMLYIDGKAVATGKQDDEPILYASMLFIQKRNSSDLVIGKMSESSAADFNGYMDELEFFNGETEEGTSGPANALPVETMDAIYAASSAGKAPYDPNIKGPNPSGPYELPAGAETYQEGFVPTIELPSASEGSPRVAFQLRGFGGLPGYIFRALETLPPGMALLSTGEIAGVPAKAGRYSFAIEMTDTPQVGASAVVARMKDSLMRSVFAFLANAHVAAQSAVPPSAPVKSRAFVTLEVKEPTGANSCVVPSDNMLVWLRAENEEGSGSFEDWVENKRIAGAPEGRPDYGGFYATPSFTNEGVNGKGFLFNETASIQISQALDGSRLGQYPDPGSLATRLEFRPNFLPPVAAEAWVKFSDLTGAQAIFHYMPDGGLGRGWRLYKDTDDYLNFCVSTDGVSERCITTSLNDLGAPTRVVADHWYHVAVAIEKRDGGYEAKLYVDGRPVPYYGDAVGVVSRPSRLLIGLVADDFRNLDLMIGNVGEVRSATMLDGTPPPKDRMQFNGIIDEIAIYKDIVPNTPVMPASYAGALYNAQGVGKCDMPVIRPASLADGETGVLYEQQLEVKPTKRSFEWSFDPALPPPPWLSIGKTTGKLSGYPTAAGNFRFGVIARETGRTVQEAQVLKKTYAITIAPGELLIEAIPGAGHGFWRMPAYQFSTDPATGEQKVTRTFIERSLVTNCVYGRKEAGDTDAKPVITRIGIVYGKKTCELQGYGTADECDQSIALAKCPATYLPQFEKGSIFE